MDKFAISFKLKKSFEYLKELDFLMLNLGFEKYGDNTLYFGGKDINVVNASLVFNTLKDKLKTLKDNIEDVRLLRISEENDVKWIFS